MIEVFIKDPVGAEKRKRQSTFCAYGALAEMTYSNAASAVVASGTVEMFSTSLAPRPLKLHVQVVLTARHNVVDNQLGTIRRTERVEDASR